MAEKKKGLFAQEQPVDPAILSEDEREAVALEVREEIDAEARAAAKEALRDKIKTEARKSKGLQEPDDEVTVDLAPYCDRILIDNRAYLQGQTYTVPVSRAQVMREAMQRTWNHQAEIDGKSENFYRRTRGARVVPAGNGAAVVNTSNLLRA